MTMGVCPIITCGGGGSLGTQKSTYVIFARPLACMSNDVPQKSRRTKDHSMNAKTLHFCILLCKLAYSMGDCVSLRGDVTHFVSMIHALLTQILKDCFCEIFSFVLSVCAIFFAFSDFGPLGKRQRHCQRQRGQRVEFSLQLTWLSHIISSKTNLDKILES